MFLFCKMKNARNNPTQISENKLPGVKKAKHKKQRGEDKLTKSVVQKSIGPKHPVKVQLEIQMKSGIKT